MEQDAVIRYAVRKFTVDVIETFAGLAIGLTIAVPGSWTDAHAAILALTGALLSASVSAGRRAWPGALDALRAWRDSAAVTP
jgi:hypothetical protein